MPFIATFILIVAPLAFADEPVLTAVSAAPAIQSVTIHGTHRHVDLATQVGQPYNASVIEKDVHQLWKMGRFDDILVETTPGADGTAVVFRVVEAPELRLHKVLITPSTLGIQLPLPEGTPLNRPRAQAAALEAGKQLHAQGYTNSRVDYDLLPLADDRVDLRLTILPGTRIRVTDVDFSGNVALDPKELRGSLRALRIRRIFGWRLLPAYSPEAVESDLARLRSLYLSKGYFDARLRLDDAAIDHNNAQVNFWVDAGPLYSVRKEESLTHARDVCTCLLAARRDAERQGILDFSATLNVQRTIGDSAGNPIADLTVTTNRGQPYRVGRIEFIGNHHYSQATLRRNFLLDEGQLLDQLLLRKSLARLNRTMLFETIDERNLAIRTNEETGLADVSVHVIERKRGAWSLSGPVGPASLAGPLQASLSSRLPWMSTYMVSLSMSAFAHPLLPLLAVNPALRLLPVLALHRPFSPADGWKSGFSYAPQLGWRASALSYAVTQMQQRLLPLLSGDRGLVPELTVTVNGPAGEGAMLCDPLEPRLVQVRTVAGLGLKLLGSMTAF